MTRAYFISILRSVKKSFSRFISIVMIIALGSAFFVGIKATAPDMLDTVQDYYVDYNLMDIRVQSSIGLTNDDIIAIQSMDSNIEAVVGQKFKDALVLVNNEIEKDIDGTQISARVYGINTSLLSNYINYGVDEAVFMNRPRLIEGEYPDAENECLVDASQLSTPESYKIGNTITLVGDNEEIDASLKQTEFTIVGIIQSPYYVSFERGNTLIGSGKVGTFIIVPESVFKQDYYTELYVKVKGSDAYDAYSDEYKNHVAPYVAMVKTLAAPRLQARVNYLQQTLPKQIADAQAMLSDANSVAGSKIKELEESIATMEQSLILLKAQLAKAEETYNVTLADAEESLALNKSEYNESITEYNKMLTEYQTNSTAYAEKYTEYSTAKSEYNTKKAEYDSAYSQVNSLELQLGSTQSAITSAQTVLLQLQESQENALTNEEVQSMVAVLQTAYPGIYDVIQNNTTAGLAKEMVAYITPVLENYQAQLIVQQQQLDAEKAKLTAANTELSNANISLTAAELELNTANEKLVTAENQLVAYNRELTSAGNEITNTDFQLSLQKIQTQMMITELSNQIEALTSGKATAQAALDTAKLQVNATLGDATEVYQQQIDDANEVLMSLGSAYWNIYDRDDTPGYTSFGSTTDNLSTLANIFPIFFFIVSALVCWTTMTRMIDEDRTTIGTLKALGYENGSIAAKYIIYSLSASIIGCSIGVAVGMYVFPYAIFAAYSIMFTIPELHYTLPIGSAIIGIATSLACTLLSTMLALRKELKSTPSVLMRPKAPKPGKRILLERIRFIWSRMKFSNKVTARNLFRNKQRFFMTIIGIAGCSALMLASLGMHNSVSAIRSKQYGNDAISKYDFQIVFENNQDGNSGEYRTVVNSNSVQSTMLISMKSVTGFSLRTDATEDVYLFVPSEPDRLNDYIRLNNRQTGKTYVPSIEGALITEKFARDTNTKAGDTLFIETSDSKIYEIFVAGVVENYTFHYIYLSPDYYTEIFSRYPTYNYAIGILNDAYHSADEATLSSLKGQMATKLMQVDGIQAVSFTSDVNQSLSEITDALTAVVAVFFFSALILAFVVLYNLTNINILERNRELATLKVLGFIDSEVNNYVLKENIILTAIGALFGSGLGIILHYLLITYAEIDAVMFGRSIEWYSFLIAIILTFVFAAIVNLIINRKLKHIDMVLSLKSIE